MTNALQMKKNYKISNMLEGINFDSPPECLKNHKKEKLKEMPESSIAEDGPEAALVKFLGNLTKKVNNLETKINEMEKNVGKMIGVFDKVNQILEIVSKVDTDISLLRVDNLMMFLSNVDKLRTQDCLKENVNLQSSDVFGSYSPNRKCSSQSETDNGPGTGRPHRKYTSELKNANPGCQKCSN